MGESFETTTKFKADIAELKSAMQDARRAVKLADAEFKSATAGMDSWESSADGLSAKLRQLNTTLNSEKTVLANLERQYAQVAKEKGENSTHAKNLAVAIEQEKAKIAQVEAELGKYEQKLEETGTASEKLEHSINTQEAELEGLKKQYVDVALEQGEGSDAAKELGQEIERLSSELQENKNKLNQAESAADEFDQTIEELDDGVQSAGDGFTVMKGALANLLADGIRATIKGVKDLATNIVSSGASFETAFAGVRKTVDATQKELDDFKQSALEMSEVKPVSADDVATIMSLGGQLGIANDKLVEFSATVADMDVATDLEIEDAATQMAQFANITGMAQGDFDKFGSTIVDLGNKSATTEPKIMAMAMRIAGAGSQVGMTDAQILGLSASLSSVGIEAEAGGTAISTIMSNIDKDVALGTKNLKTWASTAGMSASEFKDKWKNDVAGALTSVFDGLSDASAGGENLNVILDELGVTSLRQTDTMKRMSNASELLGSTIDTANTAWDENIALTNEAETFYGTTENQAKMLKNTFSNMGVAIYDGMNYPIKEAISTLKKFAKSRDGQYAMNSLGQAAGSLAKTIVKAITTILSNLDTIIPVLTGVGTAIATAFAVTKISSFITVLKGLPALLMSISNPIGLVLTAVTALVAGWYAYNKAQESVIEKNYGLTESQKENISTINEMSDAYKEMEAARTESLDAINAEYGYLTELKDELNGLIDSNGNVKEGYEDRANFIINELSEALGIEQEEIRKIIQENGNLGESIDQLIEKKKAEAVLMAAEDAYTEALKNRDAALAEYQTALQSADEAEKKYNQTKNEAAQALDTYQEMLASGSNAAEGYYQANKTLIEGNEEAKKAYEETQQALKDSEETYVGYISTIQNHEGLSAAVVSGDSAKIGTALQNMQSNFVTAEKGTRSTLQKQVKTMESELKALEKAVAAGTPGVTEQMVTDMREMVDKSTAELEKYKEKTVPAGEEGAKGVGEGFIKGAPYSEEQIQKFNKNIEEHIGDGDYVTPGWKIALDASTGLASGQTLVDDAAINISDSANTNLGSADTGATGDEQALDFKKSLEGRKSEIDTSALQISESSNQNLGASNTGKTGSSKSSDFNTGFISNQSLISVNAKRISSETNKGLGSVNMSGTGKSKTSEFNTGVGSVDTYKTAKTRVDSAANALKSVKTSTAGADFTRGFGNGMSSISLWDVAYNIGKSALNAIKSALGIASPAKETYLVGRFFNQGFINALKVGAIEVIKTAKELGKEAINALKEATDEEVMFTATAGANLLSENIRSGNAVAKVGQMATGGKGVVNNNYYSYTQNNNSPKALSRLDIYRQTKNQLAWASGGQ